MFSQIVIIITGLIAVVLTQSDHYQTRKWASVVALIGQPAWLYSSYQADLWGMLAVSCVYTAAWTWGFYKHWIKNATIDS